MEYSQPLEDTFALWPDNVEIFNLWRAAQTQWFGDMASFTGLNYAGVKVVADARGIKKKDWPGIFRTLQAMEGATLEEWRHMRK